MLVVTTCVFPNVTKTLPDIWMKYCADVAACWVGLTGGNHSRDPVSDMKRKPSSKTMLVSNIIVTTVNPRSHQRSCCEACFWHTKPKQSTSSAFKYTYLWLWKPFKGCGCRWLCAKILYLLVSRQEPVGKFRACVHFCVIHTSIQYNFPLHPSSDSFSLSASSFFFSPFCSIRASQLPFRPQKYDVWCSNDLQTISGNAHHESWKCIFPFPLWRRLHAHREIYTVIAFSFSASFFSPLSHPPSVLWWASLPLPIRFPV